MVPPKVPPGTSHVPGELLPEHCVHPSGQQLKFVSGPSSSMVVPGGSPSIIKNTSSFIEKYKPDLIISVDSYDFCISVMKNYFKVQNRINYVVKKVVKK
jgi:hypothetical protein